jgi:hypothetical protein
MFNKFDRPQMFSFGIGLGAFIILSHLYASQSNGHTAKIRYNRFSQVL